MLLPTTFEPASASPSAADQSAGSSNINNSIPLHQRTNNNSSIPSYSPAPKANANNNAKSNVCNNFLLGGSYYPGKDKKNRRHDLRQRTSSQRTLFSSRSPARIILTVLLLVGASYIGVWYVLVPMAHVTVFYYGKAVSGRGAGASGGSMRLSGDWLLRETTLKNIPSVEEERVAALAMENERERIYQHGSPDGYEPRMKLLEAISPDWFHRNNAKGENAVDVDVEETELERKTTEAITAESPDRHLRTLQTMHLFTNHTSCPADLSANNVQTTMVVQASLNRVWLLDETCARWKDPIIAVVVLTDEESHDEFIATSLKGWKYKCPQLKLIKHIMGPGEESPEMYPVNHLRNLGLDAVETSHVLIVDVDFVPSESLDETIKATLQERIEFRKHRKDPWSEEKEAVVVPAFERLLESPCTSDGDCQKHLRQNSSFIPHTFDALKECVAEHDCIVFQSMINWEGHHSTQSKTWLAGEWYDDNLTAKTGDGGTDMDINRRSIKTVQCFDSLRYEPYVVLRWCPAGQSAPKRIAPYYDERFHGYGKNKIQHVAHLRVLGYQFAILPEGFIVHYPHRESKAKISWKNTNGSELHAAMDKLYPKFLKELFIMYRDTVDHIVGLCSDD
jgi:hypothetical protein